MQHVASGTCPATPAPFELFVIFFSILGVARGTTGSAVATMSRSPDRRHYKQPETHTHTDRRHGESFYGVATLNELAACRSSLLLSLVVIVLSVGLPVLLSCCLPQTRRKDDHKNPM